MERTSESGHWYDIDGKPAYEVPYADPSKGMRGTTLRDAKKLNLFPSVTTVMNVAAKPGLERWKQNNILMSALTLPSIKDESLDDYSKRVLEDASNQAKNAAELGTYIHGSLETYYQTGVKWSDHAEIIEAVEIAMIEEFGNLSWAAERSFTNVEMGYGGKVDLFSRDHNGYVIDFKTKEFNEDKEAKDLAWPEQSIQLAAYANGLGLHGASLANVYISVNNPGLVKIHWWPETVGHYLKPFEHMLGLWQWQKQYNPSEPHKPF